MAGSSIVLLFKVTRCVICGSTATVRNFVGSFGEVGTCLLECIFQGSFQKSYDLCVFIVEVAILKPMVGSATASEPVERVMLMGHAKAAELETCEMLSRSEFPTCCIESVIRN